MRVLMFTNSVTPDRLGGLNRYVRELSAGLVRRGVEVTVSTKRVDAAHPASEIGPDGVRVVRYAMPPKSSPLFAPTYPFAVARGVGRALRTSRHRHDVVHTHFPIPAIAPAIAGTPYVHTFHAPVYKELLTERQGSYTLPGPTQHAAVRGFRAVERFVLSRAFRSVVLSEFTRSELCALSGPAGTRSVLIPGGIDVERFSPGAATPDPWARDADPVLFTARRLSPRMGIPNLVRAMPAILDRLPAAKLAIAGTGGLRAEIEREIERLGLGERVRLLGFVSEDDLVRWYRVADLVIMPTHELEGFGLTTAEALACGTPVVGTPAGATPEILGPLDPRLVARDVSAPAIAEAIVAVAADPQLLRAVRARARERVAPAMGWDAIVEQHLALYRELSRAA